MDAKKALEEYKKKVEPEMEAFFERIIDESRSYDENIVEAIQHARKIVMSGGKRARAAFMYYGYLAAGGKDEKEILKASISIEFIHAFLLVHDDVIDCDGLRHGVKTMHEYYAEMAKKHFKNKDSRHFGNSIAIIVGDMLGAFGNRALFEAKFEPKDIVKSLQKMQNIVACTAIGEAQDVYIENKGKASEEEVFSMYRNKTAKYTIEGPLHLGAILAGADDRFLRSLSTYALPAGVAFQIQDDILGIFKKSENIGKPAGSDIRQGKQTILVVKALENADPEQEKILKNCLGNEDLDEKDIENFKKVIIETGALEYAKGLAQEMIMEAKEKISGEKMPQEPKDFLLGIADYMLNREI